jgi:predicted metal-dependent hydrolase
VIARWMRYAGMPMQLGLPFHDTAPDRGRLDTPTTVSSAPVRESVTPTIASDLPMFIRHPRARRYVLRVDHEGRVRVTIPRGGSRTEATAFVQRHLAWIARQRARLTRVSMPVEARSALRDRAAMDLPVRLRELAQLHGLTVTRITIRDQRTRWGSCGRDGHICLNWRLVSMPDWVRDYVLVHELMHLRRLDHSPVYWKLVAAACPEYRQARQWLRTHGPSLR